MTNNLISRIRDTVKKALDAWDYNVNDKLLTECADALEKQSSQIMLMLSLTQRLESALLKYQIPIGDEILEIMMQVECGLGKGGSIATTGETK